MILVYTGIIGVQLWSGLLRQRCFINLPANISKPSYVPAYYRLPNSDKEYLCSTAKDNGLHRCQDLPPLRSTDFSTICQNLLPLDWQPPKANIIAANDVNDLWSQPHEHDNKQHRYEDRFIDGELVPYDLVPGDESSPFLVKQLSPLIAQSVFQPAYAPRQLDSLPSLRQKREIHETKPSNHTHHHHKQAETENIKPTIRHRQLQHNQSHHKLEELIKKVRLSKSTGSVDKMNKFAHSKQQDDNSFDPDRSIYDSSGNPPIVETNSNSDRFDHISQTGVSNGEKLRRKNYLRNRNNKGACINWNRYYTECKAGDTNPFQGTISFDNVGMAWTTIFLVISLEGWSDIMYHLQDSHSFWVWIYFVLLIVIGSFFMINLCLVVIATQFSATKKREMERMRQERMKFSSSSTLTATSESTNCYTVIVKTIAKSLRRARLSFIDCLKRRKCERLHRKRLQDRQKYLESHQVTGIHSFAGSKGDSKRNISESSRKQSKNPQTTNKHSNEIQQQAEQSQSLSNAAIRRSSWKRSSKTAHKRDQNESNIHDLERKVQSGGDLLPQSSVEPLIESQQRNASDLNRRATQSRIRDDDQTGEQQFKRSSSAKRSIKVKHSACECRYSARAAKGSNRDDKAGGYSHSSCRHFHDCEMRDIEISFCPKIISNNATLKKFRHDFNKNIEQLVDHRYFQRLILLAILINAISMGIEYHNQPEQLTEAVEISNIVFACLFLIEMILKLIAHGLYAYVIDGFNCFDGCIVILSILELFESSSGSGLSVLRTFRLLRILKLVRFMPALRRQLVIMLRTLDNVAVFFALLVLFIFIFSILGMNLFGCKFCETLPDGTERCDRKNFNSLLWSLVTVFQILTQEDWNVSC